jgi:hypothetical protein
MTRLANSDIGVSSGLISITFPARTAQSTM